MPTVTMILDMETGHTLPAFWLLKRLKAKGYRVICLGLADAEDLARRHSFEFTPIMGDIFPPGALEGMWGQATYTRKAIQNLYFSSLVSGKVLDEVMARLQPNLILINSLFYVESLAIHYRYRVPIVFVTPYLRAASRIQACEEIIKRLLELGSHASELVNLLNEAGIRPKSLKEIAQLVLQFPELVLSPKAFQRPGSPEDHVYYIGTGIDLERKEEQIQWNSVESYRCLIYCALGSQSHLQKGKSRRFLQVVIDTAAGHPDWQFFIAIGMAFDITDFPDVPANVTLCNWAPQLELLARADLMINHAGYGTVRECILMGVPMVVFPFINDRDHFECAGRVVYHGLGVKGDIVSISPDELSSLIDLVIKDRSYKKNLNLMRKKFKQEDRLELGVSVIDNVISSNSPCTLPDVTRNPASVRAEGQA